MAQSLASLRSRVGRRLGDLTTVWSGADITRYLTDAYEQLAQTQRVFWDWAYVENLPPGFSVTQSWELFLLTGTRFRYGVANYTAAFERRLLTEAARVGPGNHTSPFEATDGCLSDAAADTSIPATSVVPDSLTELSRGVWDQRGIATLATRDLRQMDSRYRVTQGEVYGLLWEFDGVRTIRKVRVPAAHAATYTVTGSWGDLRDPTDLSTATITGAVDEYATFSLTAAWERTYAPVDMGWASHTADFESVYVVDTHAASNHTTRWEYAFLTAAGATTTWSRVRGVARRIPGQQPMGPDRFGLPRRAYRDGTNVRLEHWRQGRALSDEAAICELPDRYARYLCDYAVSMCYRQAGPGQDLQLADHYAQRWVRGVARIAVRRQAVQSQMVHILGGGRPLAQRPPRPSLPWNYGAQVR